MQVLMVTRDFPPRINGGISTAVGGLVGALGAEGVGCRVVSFDAWRPRATTASVGPPCIERQGAVEVARVTALPQLDAAADFATRCSPDVVHVHHGMLWDFAQRVAAGRSTLFSMHVAQSLLRRLRGLDEPTQSESAQLMAMAQATCVTVASAAAAEAAAEVVDTRVVPLGVSAAEVADEPSERVALYVGRFGDIKGSRELLDAVTQSGDVVCWRIAGGLPDNRKADARWRRRFGATDAELLGWLSPEALAAAYRGASFVVVPSWHETFGQVILEAMQHGVPAIASETGGVTELVEHGENGLLVPPRDVPALVAAVRKLSTDEALRRRLRRGAATRAPAWRWSRRIAPWMDLYKELT